MTAVKFYDQTLELKDGETVLEGLLRYGVAVPNSCRAGACQACLLQAESGAIPAKAQAGLKHTQKALGCFLSCQCVPTGTLQVRRADEPLSKTVARVLDVQHLKADIVRVRLTAPFPFRAGQYLNIWHGDPDAPTIRSYSIASVPALENFLELHIKVIPDGKFSQWVELFLKAGDSLTIQGPVGECFYTTADTTQPLLFVAIGTGLAPLYGVIRDALTTGHSGKISLVVGARTSAHFYLRTEIAALQARYPNFHVEYVCQTRSFHTGDHANTDIYAFVKQQFPATKGMGVYLCGAESFVRKMKKQVFLCGAAMSDIHADAFLPGG